MDIKKERKRICKMEAVLELIEQAETKIANYEKYFKNFGIFGTSRESYQRNEITKAAKERLESYYEALNKNAQPIEVYYSEMPVLPNDVFDAFQNEIYPTRF